MNNALEKAVQLEIKFLETLSPEQRNAYHEMEDLYSKGMADLEEDLGKPRGN